MPDFLPDPLPPLDQIAFFRGKNQRVSFDWTGIWQPQHAGAFTVAGVMQHDILADIMAPLDQAIANGETIEMFEANLKSRLSKKGWWQPVDVAEIVDGVPTGRVKKVDLSAPWRIRTIFDTNVRAAAAAGLWRQIEETADLFPYLKYDAVNDDRTRPEHAAWDGITRRYNDPFWRTHYPPCGWFCRCTVVQLEEEEAEAQGITDEQRTRTLSSDTITTARRNTLGKIVSATVINGIDKGFGFNIGQAWMDRPAEQLAEAMQSKGRAVAQQLLEREVGSQHWDQWWAKPSGSRVTGIMLELATRSISAGRSAVVMRQAVGEKIITKHGPDAGQMKLGDFDKITQVIGDPDEIILMDDQTLVHFKYINGQLYLAPVRATAEARLPFASSFYVTNSKRLRRERSRGKIIFSRL